MSIDIAAIIFLVVTAKHLGLIGAIASVTKCNWLATAYCPRCVTFWSVLVYGTARLLTGEAAEVSGDGMALCCGKIQHILTALPSFLPRLLAISILSAYLAIWLELAEGFIDKLYDYVYKQIYPTADTPDTDAERA